jgi:valine--pyruvate aminotransferase
MMYLGRSTVIFGSDFPVIIDGAEPVVRGSKARDTGDEGFRVGMLRIGEDLGLDSDIECGCWLIGHKQARTTSDGHVDDGAFMQGVWSEGALFLWLWLENSEKTSRELYQNLKERGVLVVPGEYFFFGDFAEDWHHRHECLLISFAMDDRDLREGLRIIGSGVVGAF